MVYFTLSYIYTLIKFKMIYYVLKIKWFVKIGFSFDIWTLTNILSNPLQSLQYRATLPNPLQNARTREIYILGHKASAIAKYQNQKNIKEYFVCQDMFMLYSSIDNRPQTIVVSRCQHCPYNCVNFVWKFKLFFFNHSSRVLLDFRPKYMII